MAFFIGIGVVGLIGYGLKLVTDDANKSGIEKNKERNRYLDDIESNYGIDRRRQELNRLIEEEIHEERQRQIRQH